MQTSIDDIIDEIYEENKQYFRSRREVKNIVYRFINEIKFALDNFELIEVNEAFSLLLTEQGKKHSKNYKALKKYNHNQLLKKHNSIKHEIVNDFLT